MTDQTLPYQQTRWTLTDLYPSTEAAVINAAFQALQDKVNAFEESARPKLSADISEADFKAVISDLEEITRQAYHLGGFANLSFAADTQDQTAQTLMARVQQFMAELENQTLFFSLWWKQLDEKNAERLMAHSGDYRYWLAEMRHFKKYTLSEPEEKVINIKNVTGSSAVDTCTTRSPTATPSR